MLIERRLAVMVCGLPGSGKTFLARALAHDRGSVHISSDVVRMEIKIRGHYDPLSKREVYEEMIRKMEQAFDKGREVILDATFYKKELREKFRKKAGEKSVEMKCILTSADDALIKERVGRKRAESDADLAVYEMIRSQFEKLDEEHLEIRTDLLGLDEMLELANAYLDKE